MAIYHCSIKIISRGKGKSAVAAAAYRAGEKITNEYDGAIHDYTRKGGIVHSEILLPDNAPSEYADRAVLWNAVEKIEKAKNSQLAREIELALPVELTMGQNLFLVREYVKKHFVAQGMCADICIHDKKDGNPHAHVMLTMRPFNEDKTWGDKQKKEYILDPQGNKVYDPIKRQYKCKSIPATDWNEQTKAEEWRAAWAETTNRYLEKLGHAERVDHRSYERQGIEQIPTVHLGVAAFAMEKRGIATERGDINRKVKSHNQELKQLKARINKLKIGLDELLAEQKSESTPSENSITATQNPVPSINLADFLSSIVNGSQEQKNRWQKIADLKTVSKALAFVLQNNITTVPQLQEKVSSMQVKHSENSNALKKAERRLSVLNEHIKQSTLYMEHKNIHKQYKNEKPKKQEAFYQKHSAEIILFESAEKYLKQVMNGNTSIPIKAWKTEESQLTTEKNRLYQDYYKLKEDVRQAEIIKKSIEYVIDRSEPKDTPKRKHEMNL